MTKKFAVLGSPIAHSKSPLIHNFIFGETGFDATYERFEVNNLAEFLAEHPELDGLSLTMPLKEQAFELALSLDANAEASGGVNTLLRSGSDWLGFNTDVQGIANAVGFSPEAVAVIGSGATARSALLALPDARKLIYARNTVTAAQLANQFGAEVVDFDSAIGAELVISTITEGAFPELLGTKTIAGTLLDCVYTNPELPAGKYISGLSMLVHQAIIQQRIFQFGDPEKALNNEPELVSGVMAELDMAK